MSHLRPPIAVHVPEEWDWADDDSPNAPPTRIARALYEGLGRTNPVACVNGSVYVHSASAYSRDRIVISAGNPYRASEAFHAIDRDTYDGADDSRIRSHIGCGATEAEAALDLVVLMHDHGDIYPVADRVALCAEIACRWS